MEWLNKAESVKMRATSKRMEEQMNKKYQELDYKDGQE